MGALCSSSTSSLSGFVSRLTVERPVWTAVTPPVRGSAAGSRRTDRRCRVKTDLAEISSRRVARDRWRDVPVSGNTFSETISAGTIFSLAN